MSEEKSTSTDPLEVAAIASAVLTHLAETCAVSLEVQSASLRAAAEMIDQSMLANNAADTRRNMRTFWNRKNK